MSHFNTYLIAVIEINQSGILGIAFMLYPCLWLSFTRLLSGTGIASRVEELSNTFFL